MFPMSLYQSAVRAGMVTSVVTRARPVSTPPHATMWRASVCVRPATPEFSVNMVSGVRGLDLHLYLENYSVKMLKILYIFKAFP